jgi:hypothetical protein
MRWGSLMASRSRDSSDGDFLADDRGRWTMLDRALEGATAEHKARVRGVLLSYGVQNDNEFYMLFVAFGHLTVLVEEAPENWQALFEEFEEKLDRWATQNLRTLEAINQQSSNTERMTLSFQALAKSTTSLSGETKASLTRLDALKSSLSSLTEKLGQSESHSRTLLQKFSKTDNRIESLENLVTLISGASLAFLVVLFLGGGLAYRHIAKQNHFIKLLLVEERDRSIWTLEKAERAECWYGIKPQSDPQCQ